MDFFSEIYGNSELKKTLSSLIDGGKLSHAYLLSGPEGSGKKTIALAAAAKMASKSADEATCRRIVLGHCPDVMVIKSPEDKKTTGVDSVREFIGTVALAPDELDFKMYIFDMADKLTVQAQNALLKVIEEPPRNVYIFLLCKEMSSLIPTVRSRVQTLFTERLSPSKIREFFKASGTADVSSERFAFASRMCMGAIGKAAALMNDDTAFDVYSSVKKTVALQADKIIGASYFDFLSGIMSEASDKDRFSLMLDYMLSAYRDLIEAKFDAETESIFYEKDHASDLAEKTSAEMLEMSAEAVSKIKYGLSFNTNLTITAAVLSEKLWAAAG
ncbi:MAG: AAA family ATPase [Clostridia bacterium]|nr:AAA family ATPase [Clostridia bacterium]MBO4428447.1 AAA family ATPase [Clostridia bacterium]